MPKLKNIKIRGFRSIKEMTLELRSLNVLIGANGAGKSNLIAFFKLVNELMGGRLQQHIGATGRATANLHFGPRITPQLEAEMAFEVENGTDTYRMRLFHAAGDSMIFAEETLSFQQIGFPSPKVVSLGMGHQETRIGDEAEKNEPAAKTFGFLLNHCRVYHFHDTSPTSRVRQYCYVGDNRWLMPDAANLAALLYALKSSKETAYRRIVGTIRQVAPFFEDFDLEPTDSKDIILNWRIASPISCWSSPTLGRYTAGHLPDFAVVAAPRRPPNTHSGGRTRNRIAPLRAQCDCLATSRHKPPYAGSRQHPVQRVSRQL